MSLLNIGNYLVLRKTFFSAAEDVKELHFGGFLTKKRPDNKQSDMVKIFHFNSFDNNILFILKVEIKNN